MIEIVKGCGYDCNRWYVIERSKYGDKVLFHSLNRFNCEIYLIRRNNRINSSL